MALALVATIFAPLQAAPPPGLTFADLRQLHRTRELMQQGDDDAQAELRRLLARADDILKTEPPSVVQKTRTAPSGDKHDYLTLAPYWWPDPKKKDGLPWIRRDGQVNPQTRGRHVDYNSKQEFFNRVNSLGMAAFYSGDLKYARAAVATLETWFVNPDTRMNPNLNYAQGVPGRNDGRCFGIIEWCDIEKLVTPIELLRAKDMFPDAGYAKVVKWLERYLDWLLTSDHGREESRTRNNHATWYDVQVAGLLLFLDREDEARKLLESVKTRRIATQIEPDGSQPHELARTKPVSYSRMNFRAFRHLASLGAKVGVDLWNFETADGRSLRKAEKFLATLPEKDPKPPGRRRKR